jgi:hypothetical protein
VETEGGEMDFNSLYVSVHMAVAVEVLDFDGFVFLANSSSLLVPDFAFYEPPHLGFW